MMGMRRLFLVCAAAGALTACREVPTSALLALSSEPPAPRPELVSLRVFDPTGVAFDATDFIVPPLTGVAQTLGGDSDAGEPDAGTPAQTVDGPPGRKHLGDVAIFPPRPTSSLRVVAVGRTGGIAVSYGVARASLTAGQQVRVELILSATAALDSDGDGVPDAIDVCPSTADPLQADADGDGRGDACVRGDSGAEVDGASVTLGLGAPCANADACSSGFCVDGVCCEAACADLCRACNLAPSIGRCTVVPDGQDPRNVCREEPVESCGLDGTCDGLAGCRKRRAGTICAAASCSAAGQVVTAATCDGGGECVAGEPRACAPYNCAAGVCRTDCQSPADCAPGLACANGACGTFCSGDGDCPGNAYCENGGCRNRQGMGANCASASSCVSGFCVDGRCCESACQETCKRCDSPAGRCTFVNGGSPDYGAATPCRRPAVCNGAGVCIGG